MLNKRGFCKSVRGFTLIELMVSLTIVLTVTGLLLENYPESTIRLTLLNNTHAFALLVREAQVRGSAIDSGYNTTAGGYGVYINLATSSQALLYSDSVNGVNLVNSAGLSVGDGVYDESVSPDIIKNTLLFKKGFEFKKICVASSTAVTPYGFLCNTSNSPPINNLNISFSRPSQNAHIYINNSTSTDFASACVQIYSIKSPNVGHVRSILIYHSGMVTTVMTPCD